MISHWYKQWWPNSTLDPSAARFLLYWTFDLRLLRRGEKGVLPQHNAGSLDWTNATLDCFNWLYWIFEFWTFDFSFIFLDNVSGTPNAAAIDEGRATVLRHVIVKKRCHVRRQQIDAVGLIAFLPYKWTIGSIAHSTPITETARHWPYPSRTQTPYKKIWLLKKACNTKLLTTKLHSRTPAFRTVGLPSCPTTPQ